MKTLTLSQSYSSLWPVQFSSVYSMSLKLNNVK